MKQKQFQGRDAWIIIHYVPDRPNQYQYATSPEIFLGVLQFYDSSGRKILISGTWSVEPMTE